MTSNRCYVCDTVSEFLEDHHVVPRHLGGEHGPTVPLCGGCHQEVHTYAEQKYRRNPQLNVEGYGITRRLRLEELSDIIVKAKIKLEGHPGKKWKYNCTLTDDQHSKLVRLALVYGSQDKAVLAALDALYNNHFV